MLISFKFKVIIAVFAILFISGFASVDKFTENSSDFEKLTFRIDTQFLADMEIPKVSAQELKIEKVQELPKASPVQKAQQVSKVSTVQKVQYQQKKSTPKNLVSVEKPKTQTEIRPVHKGSEEQQQYIDYAWETYHDKNFIYLMKAENGLISPDRKHPIAYRCGKKIAHDWGFGGISDCYHSEITSDERFATDWKWQIQQLHNLYATGTKFSSKARWPAQSKYFTWVPNTVRMGF